MALPTTTTTTTTYTNPNNAQILPIPKAGLSPTVAHIEEFNDALTLTKMKIDDFEKNTPSMRKKRERSSRDELVQSDQFFAKGEGRRWGMGFEEELEMKQDLTNTNGHFEGLLAQFDEKVVIDGDKYFLCAKEDQKELWEHLEGFESGNEVSGMCMGRGKGVE